MSEITFEITVLVVSSHHQPAEPENNIPYGYTEIDELEFYDNQELITDKAMIAALNDYVFKNHIDEVIESVEDERKQSMEESEIVAADERNAFRKDEGGFW